MNLMTSYNESLKAIFDHVGFTLDYRVFPIEDITEYYWKIQGEEVRYFETLEAYKEGDESKEYSGSIFGHRFYPKSVYEGKDYTLIFLDTHCDSNRFFAIFSNDRKILD